MLQDTDKCVVPWCTGKRNRSGKGYCRRHYDQIRKYGHILNTRTTHDRNEIIVDAECAYIILADRMGEEIGRVKIDIEDVDLVKAYRWTDNGNGYIRTFIGTTPLYLHRLLTGSHGEVDHINRDKKDNRRSNLRVVEHYVNCHNRGEKRPGMVKGRMLKKPYIAKLDVKGKHIHLGYYSSYQEAEERIKTECARLGL